MHCKSTKTNYKSRKEIHTGRYMLHFYIQTTMRNNLILLLLALLPIGASAYTLGRISVHDPSIVWDQNPTTPTYYIFGSFREVAKTTDWMNWARLTLGTDPAGAVGVPWNVSGNSNAQSTIAFNTPALAGTTPTGAKKAMPSFDAEAWSAKGGSQGKSEYDITGNLWAPDVIYNTTMNKWCMYMSVNGDNWYSSIVLLTADNIEGPYTYQGPVVVSGFTNSDYKDTDLEMVLGEQTALPERYNNPWVSTSKAGYPNNIDPCVFYDGNNKLWMSYGSWSGGIFMLELDESTGLRDYSVSYDTDDTSDGYFGKKIAGGYYSSGEASYIEKIGDYYYLFLSYGGLMAGGDTSDYNNGGYQMRVFRSTSPDGPYLDPMGQNAVLDKYYLNFGAGSGYKVFGENIFGCYTDWGNITKGADGERSQGHNSIIAAPDGRTYLVYHTRFQNRGEGHEVRVHQVFQSEDGWLMAAPFEYTGETVTSADIATSQQVADDDIPGTYKLLIHRNRLDHTKKEAVTPVEIQLLTGGTITGEYTGSWSITAGKSYINITLGSTEYKGVLIKQKMEPSTEEIPAFSVMSSSDGVSIWGHKYSQQEVVATEPYDYTTGVKAYYNFDASTIKNYYDDTQVATLQNEGTNSAPVLQSDGVRDGKVIHTQFGASGNTSNAKFTNPLYGETLEDGATIAFWVNPLEQNLWDALIGFQDANGGRLYMTGNNYVGYNSGGYIDMNHPGSVTTYDFTFGEWNFVTLTISRTAGVNVYINGLKKTIQTSANGDATLDYNALMVNFLQDCPDMYFGYGSWWGSANALFDELLVYSRALTENDAKALYLKELADNKFLEVADPAELPKPVYFNDFSTNDGVEIVGSGEFIVDANANFGRVYHNDPSNTSAVRTNYLKLPADILSRSATSKEMTIGFWVNKKSEDNFFFTPLFAAYGAAPTSEGNTWPMFVCETRGLIQVNCAGYCDFGLNANPAGSTYNDGTPYVTSAWLDDGNWHYYTVALTATTAKVYVDGELKNGWTVDGTSDGQVISGLFTNGADLKYITLGGNQAWNWADADPAFAFDDFAVYAEALTAAQIQKIITDKNATITSPVHYTVKANYGSKTKVLSSGEAALGSVSVAYPRYILDGTTLYEAAATSSKYSKTFTLSYNNQEEVIEYTASTTPNMYYYAEAEDILSGATSDLPAASNGKLGGRQKTNSAYTELVTLPAGTWQIATDFYVGNSGDHTVNFKVGDEVKWTFTKGANSGWYNGTSENIVLTESATVSVAVDGGSATGLDWIYIKSINDFETVGNTDCTTGYLGATRDYTLKKGETKVFYFKNYGLNTEAYQNWVIRVKEGDVDKTVTRADFWDNILSKHLDTDGNDSADDWAVQSNDGGTSRVGLDWEAFKEDMKDANVEARVTYGNDGSLTISAVSTGAQSVRKYYVDNVGHVSGLTGDLTVSLSVDHARLEIISVESSHETLTLADDGTGVTGLTEGWTGNIQWNRAFAGGKKHTVCLPFEPTALLTSGKVFEFTGISGDKMVMTEVSATTLEANKPYIFEPTADMTDITFNNVTVNIGQDPKTTQADFTFQGTYTSKTTWTEAELGKCYGFTAKAADGYEQGMFAKLNDGASAKPFRAYLQYTGSGTLKDDLDDASAGTRGLVSLPDAIGIIWVMADGTTAISSLTQQSQQTTANGWYTLDGRKLSGKPSKKGVYVSNGQKVIIK